MSEYTPTTEEVRARYVSTAHHFHRTGAEFDRWINQVRAEARQELIDELVAIGLCENDEWDAVERVLPGVLRVIGLT